MTEPLVHAKPRSPARIVSMLLFLLGAVLVAYAISDHPLYGGEPGFGAGQGFIALLGVLLIGCGFLPRSIAGSVLLLALSTLAMLGFAEVAAEIVLGPRYRPIFQPDDRLIFKFIPDRQSVMTRSPVNGGVTVMHKINSAGFRGEELRPSGEAVRVMVYGDSFIHAIYTADAETFTARLGAALEDRLRMPVEAVNAGVSSYGPDQQSLKMEDELPRLRPDLVIAAIFAGNDYGDLVRNKMFRIGTDGQLVDNRWQLDPKVRMWFQLGQKESILKRAIRDRYDRMRPRPQGIMDVIDMDFLLKQAELEFRNYAIDHDDVVSNTHMDYYSAAVSLTPGSAAARYEIALMQGVLRRMRDVAARNGVPLAFLFIPHPFDVTDRYDDWKVDRKRFPKYDSRNQVAPLEDIARQLDVPFVSLYDPFRAVDANTLYFHGGDDHWNAAGQAMAARIMADYLRTKGLPAARGRGAAAPPSPSGASH